MTTTEQERERRMRYFSIPVGNQRMFLPILGPHSRKAKPDGWNYSIVIEASKDGEECIAGVVQSA